MDKFALWTGLAHATLAKSHPKLKRSQAGECLASWLGHRTYASWSLHDRARLGAAKYVITDGQAAIGRARSLGFAVTPEQWQAVRMVLSPSGISGGCWLTSLDGMNSAARLIFEDQGHPDVGRITGPIGMPDGRWGKSVVCHAASGSHPDELRFTVQGEVRAFDEDHALAVPVAAEVLFRRIGAQLYAQGEILSVVPVGPAYPYEPEFLMDDYGAYHD